MQRNREKTDQENRHTKTVNKCIDAQKLEKEFSDRRHNTIPRLHNRAKPPMTKERRNEDGEGERMKDEARSCIRYTRVCSTSSNKKQILGEKNKNNSQ